ncbi:hypothetical protein ES708_25894 [subsurface metagenome]
MYNLFYDQITRVNVREAIERLKNFSKDYVLSMIGTPDLVVGAFNLVSEVTEGLRGFSEDILEPVGIPNLIQELEYWIINQVFGIDVEEWKAYYSDPSNYIDPSSYYEGVPNPRDSRLTHELLDDLMGFPPEEDGMENEDLRYNPQEFSALMNTVVTAKLSLLDATTLNKMLRDNYVDALYEEEIYPNFMLGFMHTLDGNHQWRLYPPEEVRTDEEGAWSQRYGPGMPIWTDCIARELVFRRLFTDWQHGNFPDDGDCCPPVSITTPRVLDPDTGEERSTISGCDKIIISTYVINHQGDHQDFAYYVKVDLGKGQATVFHRWSDGTSEPAGTHGTLQPFESLLLEVEATIPINRRAYITAYVYSEMISLDPHQNPRIPGGDPERCPLVDSKSTEILINTPEDCEGLVEECGPDVIVPVYTLEDCSDQIKGCDQIAVRITSLV